MSGINKVILVGNLGKDPEVRHLEGGTAVAKFPLATTESFKNKEGQRINQTEWHNIVLWRGLAEISGKYLNKGMQVYIEGKIKSRSWDDKDGNKRYITEIVADNMTILGKREDSGSTTSEENSETGKTETQSSHANESDGLPF